MKYDLYNDYIQNTFNSLMIELHDFIDYNNFMRILICDDDFKQCEILKNMIEKHSSVYEITMYHSAEELFFECENTFPFDCIFLDIQMKEMNGIECARKIREYDSKINLVFLTAVKDYVFEGYEVNAVRYLLKPLCEDKCFEVLDLIEKNITQKHFLYVNKTKIDCDDITYIESYGHYCSIHSKETIEVKTSISSLLSQLPDFFIQTHRSYLVNLKHLESIRKDACILTENIQIPIARSSIQKVNQAFMEYIKRGMLT